MNFNGIYTQIELSKNQNELIQSLKESYALQNNIANFFEIGAKVLKSIESPHIVNLTKIEKTSNNVLVYSNLPEGESLMDFLATRKLNEDQFYNLCDQIISGLTVIHLNGIPHQGLNPRSLWVNKDGNISIFLFEVLEMRFEITDSGLLESNEHMRIIYQFFSPERKKSPRSFSFTDDYYSLGLILWYVWCVKEGLITAESAGSSLPNFFPTGTPMDRLWQVCMNNNPDQRPKAIANLISVQSQIKLDLTEKMKNSIFSNESLLAELLQHDDTSDKNEIVIHNYNSNYHQVYCNKNAITTLYRVMSENKLTLIAPKNSLIEIVAPNGVILSSFNTNEQKEFTLPLITEKLEDNKRSKVVSNNFTVVIAVLLLIMGGLIYLRFYSNNEDLVKKKPDPSGATNMNLDFPMIPPEGYQIRDTNNNDLMRKIGMKIDGECWRFKEGNWEKCISGCSSYEGGEWVRDNSKKDEFLEDYFVKIDDIVSSDVAPNQYKIIEGNQAILSANGMQALDGKYYRYVNSNWYIKELNKWKMGIDASAHSELLENYFVKDGSDCRQEGYIIGEDVTFRSEPSDQSINSIIGHFNNYMESYENSNDSPSKVCVYKIKNEWMLGKIEDKHKVGWFKAENFRENNTDRFDDADSDSDSDSDSDGDGAE